jgi:hypothetical protein
MKRCFWSVQKCLGFPTEIEFPKYQLEIQKFMHQLLEIDDSIFWKQINLWLQNYNVKDCPTFESIADFLIHRLIKLLIVLPEKDEKKNIECDSMIDYLKNLYL